MTEVFENENLQSEMCLSPTGALLTAIYVLPREWVMIYAPQGIFKRHN